MKPLFHVDLKKEAAIHVVLGVIHEVLNYASASATERFFALLWLFDVNIGNRGHGRQQIPKIVLAVRTVLDQFMLRYLNQPLPATGLRPHIGITADMATFKPLKFETQISKQIVFGEMTSYLWGMPTVYGPNSKAATDI